MNIKDIHYKHIIESQQFNVNQLIWLFGLTQAIKELFETKDGREKLRQCLPGKIINTFFYEPSTRTRLSFVHAAYHLGASQVTGTENASEFSSAIKGETLEDTMRILCSYHPDVIIMRSKKTGDAERAVKITDQFGVPLINAGDGSGQHPTQSLTDVFTIYERFALLKRRTFEKLTVVMCGDLKNGRTVRSLSYLLAKFPKMKLVYMSPAKLQIGADILEYLAKHKICHEIYTEKDPMEDVLLQADVLYMTRVQKERMNARLYKKVAGIFQFTKEKIQAMPEESIIMHPLPRVDEISTDVDDDPRAYYFKQAQNGMFVRMALLLMLLDPKKAEGILHYRVKK